MKNEKVIKEFLNGRQAKTPLRDIYGGCWSTYKGRTLYTENNKLINYSTIIAYFENGYLYLNTKKYSITTTKIQNTIKRLAESMGIIIKEYEG